MPPPPSAFISANQELEEKAADVGIPVVPGVIPRNSMPPGLPGVKLFHNSMWPVTSVVDHPGTYVAEAVVELFILNGGKKFTASSNPGFTSVVLGGDVVVA